jgi:hypothetical protein
MVYIVVEYMNENKKQPLKIVYKDEDILKAKKYAYDKAFSIYGNYIEDLKCVNIPYIKNNFWNIESLYEYSDWSVDMLGHSDNIVYAVIEIKIQL